MNIGSEAEPRPNGFAGTNDERSRERLLPYDPGFGRKKCQQRGRQRKDLKDEKEEEKKEGNVEGGAQEAELVGACFAVFGDITGEEKQAAGQYPQGDERVGIIADPAKKKRPGAKNDEIYDKSSSFQKTGALSEACAIRVLPLQKGEVEEIFFN